jgi:kojibiose phosphorylase
MAVPVKLLSGDYYQGATFYDTDLYILPFYTCAFPKLARNHLTWRHAGLEHAAQIARRQGFSGAKFAWQAGPLGEECLGNWYRFTHTNIHINSDIVHALRRYVQITGDETLLHEIGLDILIQTARFFVSRAVWSAERNAFSLYEVTGPDEGHCATTDNFYTSHFAKRCLQWAADAVEQARGTKAFYDTVSRLQFDDAEPSRWRHVADRLRILFDSETRLYEQFEGFFDLDPARPDTRHDRRDWFAAVHAHQALNQPDVLLAMALLPEEFPADVVRANWEYYRDKSMDFSSMSFAPNALIAARMGDLPTAYHHFMISAGMDLDESLTGRCDTYAGLHGTASGGAWMAAVLGFGGVQVSESGLCLDPRLPLSWDALRFTLRYYGQVLRVDVTRTHVKVTNTSESGALHLTIHGQIHSLPSGGAVEQPLVRQVP